MTIQESIKKEMLFCPLTVEQEAALLKGIENYLDHLEKEEKLTPKPSSPTPKVTSGSMSIAKQYYKAGTKFTSIFGVCGIVSDPPEFKETPDIILVRNSGEGSEFLAIYKAANTKWAMITK